MLIDEVPEEKQDRRSNKIRFDKSINLGSLLSLVAILYTLFSFWASIKERFDKLEDSSRKTDVMWEHFLRENPNITPYDLERVR